MVLAKTTLANLALASIASASPIAQDISPIPQLINFRIGATNCGLAADDPKSWGASGGEKLLAGWLDKNGPASNSCTAPEYSQTCDKYDYLFVRLMSTNINSAFKGLDGSLTDNTISTSLQVSSLIKEFDVAQKPGEDKLPGFLKNLALGPTTIGALVAMNPAGAIAGGVISLFGVALGAAADNIENNKQDVPFPTSNDFAAAMESRLNGFFVETRTMLKKTLTAIFGGGTKDESDQLLRAMIGRMSGIGIQGLDNAAKAPVAELLKSGDFLRSVPESDLLKAMDAAFARTRQGLIGNLLAAMQVYVEQEMPAYNEGEVQACTALGTMKEANSCHVIKHIPFDKNTPGSKPLDSKYLEAMGKYGIDLHTLIRNVRDCNNGEVKHDIKTDGSLPTCFYGMNFAQRAHPKDVQFFEGVIRKDIPGNECISAYQNLGSVPEWIKGKCTHEIPKWAPCKVTMQETTYWTEGGLDRYQFAFIGENIDVAPICPYAQDGRRCRGASNRACYFKEDLKKWVVDVNFAKGPGGHNDYKQCRDDIRDSYARDNRCTAA
ncbi:hypothetical protein DE146DRAFT_765499 [Phaeosphaeria sp. MPI-PUGE-AT-0046c]|nr:hypothetical protein DE146DRAFT_765499 [Phaeosphaeria sp. MPI-PUGE-AT-0046c]